MTEIIRTHDLTKRYGELVAVDRLNLTVNQGTLFGLLGPNGSGKTTIIKLLTGQVRASDGTATVMGLDVAGDPVEVRRRVGVIPEQETPPSFLTAEEYLHFVGAVRKLSDTEEQAAWWFDFFEFEDKKDVLCKDLSRGTRQKLMFAQAFLHRPALALIDEPLINLDPIMQKKVKDFLTGYVADGGTIFISTHILEIAEEICTDFAILHRGRLLHQGKAGSMKEQGGHLADFFLDLVHQQVHV